ncbi:hypothetical protein P4132_12945, partial [Pseudomonas aeruginosa]|nr:hypothetical protein [Pseudomonas aeruginosa]
MYHPFAEDGLGGEDDLVAQALVEMGLAAPERGGGALRGSRVKRRTKNAKAFHDKCENTCFPFLIEVKTPTTTERST